METEPIPPPTVSQHVSAGLSSLRESVKKLEVPLKSAFLSSVVFAVKKLSTKLAFNCPDRVFKLYSLMFIFGPVLAFFCLAMMLSKSFWKLVAGCCRLPRAQRRIIWRRSRQFLFLCSIPPIVWLLFVLAETEYYVCAKLGPLDARLNRTEPSQQPSVLSQFEIARAESQILAIVLLSSVLVVSTLLLSLDRCCTKAESAINDDEEYVQYLGEEEVNLFNMGLKPMAQKQAKEHLEALYEKYKDVSNPGERIRLVATEIQGEFPWVSDSN